MRLEYAALSDVGRVRKDNQDSGYAGAHLLVIADGVGGSARGDVASAAAVTELRRLDEPPAEDAAPDSLLSALAGAIHRSHDRIAELVRDSPELEGTSTTVTAAIFDGSRLGVGHVGDSRGYLLRDGELAQLTTDHSFVQSLIDEGRITEDEARVHPHRNLILRAVDGVHEPEPDVFTLDLAPGDRVLLCSDGCSGVLESGELARLLGSGHPEHVAATLVTAALDAGSTDNVTVVVADVVDDADPPAGAGAAAGAAGPVVVGAAAASAHRAPAGAATHRDTGEMAPVGDEPDVDPEDLRYAPRAPRRFAGLRRVLVTLLLLGLAAVVAVAGYRWTQSQYYVSNDGDGVVIYQGVEADVPGVDLHHVEEETDLVLDDLPEYNRRQVRDGISAGSLADARDVVEKLVRLVPCPSPSPSPSPSPRASRSPDASAAPSPRPTRSPSAGASPSGSASPSAPTTTPAVCEPAS